MYTWLLVALYERVIWQSNISCNRTTSIITHYLSTQGRPSITSVHRGVAVVEWLRSRPLDCEVRGSNPGQGRNLKNENFCFRRTPAVVKVCHPCRVRLIKTPLYKT